MRIQVNGDWQEVAAGSSIAGLLASLAIDAGAAAVERNLLLVKREQFSTTVLQEGDKLEIVTFVGGG